eukprot:3535422-Rhodomonas_salina.1
MERNGAEFRTEVNLARTELNRAKCRGSKGVKQSRIPADSVKHGQNRVKYRRKQTALMGRRCLLGLGADATPAIAPYARYRTSHSTRLAPYATPVLDTAYSIDRHNPIRCVGTVHRM